MLASMLSDRQLLEFFLESIAKKCKNGQFFAFSQIKWDFATASYIQGTTMWKLTSWRLRKCITYWVFKFLNRSYCWSKSEDSEILPSLAKIRGRKKKQHSVKNQVFGSILNQPLTNPIPPSLIQYGASNLIFGRVLFFFTAPFLAIFFFRFGSTSTANS